MTSYIRSVYFSNKLIFCKFFLIRYFINITHYIYPLNFIELSNLFFICRIINSINYLKNAFCLRFHELFKILKQLISKCSFLRFIFRVKNCTFKICDIFKKTKLIIIINGTKISLIFVQRLNSVKHNFNILELCIQRYFCTAFW